MVSKVSTVSYTKPDDFDQLTDTGTVIELDEEEITLDNIKEKIL